MDGNYAKKICLIFLGSFWFVRGASIISSRLYHREKFMEIVHVVYETLSTLKCEILLVFCSFLCVSLNVLMSFFNFMKKFLYSWKKLTNTFKLTHKNEKNTNRTSHLSVEEFHIPHELSINFFYLWLALRASIIPWKFQRN